jgi:hypothetical protein
MYETGDAGDALLAGTQDEGTEESGPQANPHPSIAHSNGEFCRLGLALVPNVARGAEALSGFGIDGDQRLVVNVIDHGQEFELTAREPGLGSEEAVETRLLAGALESLLQPLAVSGLDRPNQGLCPVSKLDDLTRIAHLGQRTGDGGGPDGAGSRASRGPINVLKLKFSPEGHQLRERSGANEMRVRAPRSGLV